MEAIEGQKEGEGGRAMPWRERREGGEPSEGREGMEEKEEEGG